MKNQQPLVFEKVLRHGTRSDPIHVGAILSRPFPTWTIFPPTGISNKLSGLGGRPDLKPLALEAVTEFRKVVQLRRNTRTIMRWILRGVGHATPTGFSRGPASGWISEAEASLEAQSEYSPHRHCSSWASCCPCCSFCCKGSWQELVR
jgi:hypothetical protein